MKILRILLSLFALFLGVISEPSVLTLISLTTFSTVTTVPQRDKDGKVQVDIGVATSIIQSGSVLITGGLRTMTTPYMTVSTYISVLTSTYVTTDTAASSQSPMTSDETTQPSMPLTLATSTSGTSSTSSATVTPVTPVVTYQNPSKKLMTILIGVLAPISFIATGTVLYIYWQRGKRAERQGAIRSSFAWIRQWRDREPAEVDEIQPRARLPPPRPIPYGRDDKEPVPSPPRPVRPPRPQSLSPTIGTAMQDPPRGSYLYETDSNYPAVPFEPTSPTVAKTTPTLVNSTLASSPKITSTSRAAGYDGSHKKFYEEANKRNLSFSKLAHPGRDWQPKPHCTYKKSGSNNGSRSGNTRLADQTTPFFLEPPPNPPPTAALPTPPQLITPPLVCTAPGPGMRYSARAVYRHELPAHHRNIYNPNAARSPGSPTRHSCKYSRPTLNAQPIQEVGNQHPLFADEDETDPERRKRHLQKTMRKLEGRGSNYSTGEFFLYSDISRGYGPFPAHPDAVLGPRAPGAIPIRPGSPDSVYSRDISGQSIISPYMRARDGGEGFL